MVGVRPRPRRKTRRTLPDRPSVEVVHRLTQRVHLRAPALSLQRAACQRIADRLAREFEGHRIAIRPQTGSVFAQLDAGTVDAEALAERLAALMAQEHDERDHPLLERRGQAGRPTDLARAIVTAFRGVNDDVRAALDGKADLAALAPVILAVSSAAQVALGKDMTQVPWFNLLWYSVRTFLSFNEDALADGRAPNEDATS
jgi:hypothetical protein